MSSEGQNDNWTPVGIFIGAVAVFTLGAYITLIAWFVRKVFDEQGNAVNGESLGQLGDFVGGIVNPFVAFISVVGLIATVFFTRRQLEISLQASQHERRLSLLTARLASTQSMVDIARNEVARFDARARIGAYGARSMHDMWRDREEELNKALELIFVELHRLSTDSPFPTALP